MSTAQELNNDPGLTWSHPGGPGESAGMVWYGLDQCTPEDIKEIKEFIGSPDTAIDKLSLPGRYHPDWNSVGYASVGERNPNGGLGSVTYEQQKTGTDNVRFAKEPIWYYTADGDLIKDIPPEAGAYYKRDMGDGYYDNVEGPEPDSPADKWRAGGEYYWDDENQWYQVRNR